LQEARVLEEMRAEENTRALDKTRRLEEATSLEPIRIWGRRKVKLRPRRRSFTSRNENIPTTRPTSYISSTCSAQYSYCGRPSFPEIPFNKTTPPSKP